MRKLFLVILTIFLFVIPTFARTKYQDIAGKGGKVVKTSTIASYKLEETYPLCTVDIYLAGTTTHASIYSNNSGTVKSNPFTAGSDASYFFYANSGRYDIKFSGTGVASAFTKADVLLTEAKYAEFPAESSGANGNSANNTPSIQAAINLARDAGGGKVSITTPGIYNIQTAGNDPYYTNHKYCLEITGDNIEFNIGTGVTIQLASGQQVNGAPVNIFITRSKNNITFSGSGTISGNAPIQSYSDGYSQIDHGLILSFYGSSGIGANNDITIKDLTLKNHFSNPINIDKNSSATKNTNITISNVHTIDCGEGIQVIAADDILVENCIVESPNHVAVADGIEISNSTKFKLIHNTIKNHRAASGYDIFGSTDGVIDDFISDDNDNGIVIHSFSGAVTDPKNIIVTNGVIINPRDVTGVGVCDGVEINANTFSNVKVTNIIMKGTAFFYGFQIAANALTKGVGPIIIENCTVDTGIDGIIANIPFNDFYISGGSYTNMSNRGIVLVYSNGLLAADVKNLVINNVKATNNGGYGIQLNNQGFTIPTISGNISNCYLEDNGSGPLDIQGIEVIGITTSNNIPNFISTNSGGAGAKVFGIKFLSPVSGDVSTFKWPSKNQELVLVFTENRIIIDRRQAGGNNIDLASAVNFAGQAGDSLSLRYNNLTSRWYETGRSVNH